jgi:hypothetical protein
MIFTKKLNTNHLSKQLPFITSFSFGCFLGLILLGLSPLQSCTKKESSASNLAIDTSLLQEGDFIVRRGYGIVSTFIANNYGGSYHMSHVGIVVKQGPKISVIHSISRQLSNKEGVVEDSLSTFIKDAKTPLLMVYSPVPGSKSQRHLIASTAKRLAKKNTPFDLDFDLADTTQLFCTELVMYCMQQASPADSSAIAYRERVVKGLDIFENQQHFLLKFVLNKNP